MLGATLLTVILPLKQPDPTRQLVGFGIALIMIVCTALCIQLFLATYYAIDHDRLNIHGGWLYKRKKIPVASIRKIEKTRTFISAPAPSLIGSKFSTTGLTAFSYRRSIKQGLLRN
jgi:Protein of unknown function (DUF1200).